MYCWESEITLNWHMNWGMNWGFFSLLWARIRKKNTFGDIWKTFQSCLGVFLFLQPMPWWSLTLHKSGQKVAFSYFLSKRQQLWVFRAWNDLEEINTVRPSDHVNFYIIWPETSRTLFWHRPEEEKALLGRGLAWDTQLNDHGSQFQCLLGSIECS